MGGVRSVASNEIEIRVNLPAPTAWLWVKVVDPSGQCIESATIQVIGGQGVGPPMTQLPPCGAWDDGGIFFTDLIPGVEMTLLASAPGYEPQVSTDTPSLAQPVQSVTFGLWPIESVSTPN